MKNIIPKTIFLILLLCNFGCHEENPAAAVDPFAVNNDELNTDALIERAKTYLTQPPIPLTSATSDRSEGGPHDFYSEGDYWWPDASNPDGPYVRRDGKTNPDNFVAHRQAMWKLNEWVSTLVSAYKLTGDRRYADHAMVHLNAFFLDPATLMNPNLLYAQAIKGKVSGRGIGIIDTIHLIEVARAIEILAGMNYLKGKKLTGLKDWFEAYATWMNTHEYGLAEKDHGNNHSTWWATQVAAFAHLTGDEELMDVARSQFKKLISAQLDDRGGFTDELQRTKPYSYTLFHLEGYSLLCDIASTPTDNLWTYEGAHGGIRKAWDFILPAVKDKSTWQFPPDIEYYDQVPIQSTGMLLAARAYQDEAMMAIWRGLSPERKSDEVNRTFAIREPVLWLR
jgi:hypothetical protein